MDSTYHSHRRRRKARSAARLGIAGGVTGVLGVTAVAGVIVVTRDHAEREQAEESAPRTMAVKTTAIGARPHVRPKTGEAFAVSTPDGFTYALAAVRSGASAKPLTSTRSRPRRAPRTPTSTT